MTPVWKTLRNDALQAWRESLTPEQAAEFEAFVQRAKGDREARRLARFARLASARERDAKIIGLVLDGKSTEEIAGALTMSRRAVRHCLSRLGVGTAGPGMRRIPCGWLSLGARDTLHQLAAERGEAPVATLEVLLTYALDESGLHARRLLRLPPPATTRAA